MKKKQEKSYYKLLTSNYYIMKKLYKSNATKYGSEITKPSLHLTQI